MQIKITPEIWEDPDFIELGNDEKLAFFWMLTRCNLVGYVEVTDRKLRRDMDVNGSPMEGLTKCLPRAILKTERGYLLLKFISYQLGRGDALVRNNITKSAARELAGSSNDVYQAIIREYPEMLRVLDTMEIERTAKQDLPGKGLPSPCQAHAKGEEKEKEKEGGMGETKPSDALLEFPLQKTGDVWWLTRSKCQEWAESFPGVDIMATCRVARQWCIDNPAKRKTCKGMPNFLSGWIRRNLDKGQAALLRPGQAQQWDSTRQDNRPAVLAPPHNWKAALLVYFEREGMVVAIQRLAAGIDFKSWDDVPTEDRLRVREIAHEIEQKVQS